MLFPIFKNKATCMKLVRSLIKILKFIKMKKITYQKDHFDHIEILLHQSLQITMPNQYPL